jgi:hypothetical protein
MNTRDPIALALPTLVGVLAFLPIATAQVPNSIAAPGEAVVLKVHAEGAQIYECKASPDAKLVWQFREPIATLIADGNTVGRHYAGPNWELADGSAIVGKVVGDAPGADANDIPWLKLNVVAQRGNGTLTGVTTVQRINTQGGKLNGTCDEAGKLRRPHMRQIMYFCARTSGKLPRRTGKYRDQGSPLSDGSPDRANVDTRHYS